MTEENQKEEQVEEVKIIRHETLVEALAYAQLEYEPLKHNKQVDYLTKAGDKVHYSYCTLAALREATDPHLNKHGLVVKHRTELRDKREIIIGKLSHAFGDQIEEAEMDITESSGDMQEFGKLMTYAMRYTFQMLTGRASETDTDAKDSQRSSNKQQPPDQQPGNQQGNKPLDAAKTAYFALLSKNKVFKDDVERHDWQRITGYGASTEQWKLSDVKGATGLMNWRLEVGLESDQLLEYITTKAKSTKGLKKQFLAIMGAFKLTAIKDVGQWKIGMASAKLSIDHKLEAALDMGKVLMRSSDEIFTKFKAEVEVDKLSKMNADQVGSWEPFLKLAVDKYNKENADAQVDFDKLVKGEEGSE